MAASARIPAGQKGPGRNWLGGTNGKRPRRPPELTHRPGGAEVLATRIATIEPKKVRSLLIYQRLT